MKLCTSRLPSAGFKKQHEIRLKTPMKGRRDVVTLRVHGKRLDDHCSCSGMVAASLACTQMQGCFVEVGKRDIWSPQRVAQERPDLAYRLVAIDFWTPEFVGRNMMRLAAMLSKGGALNAGGASR